MTGIAIWLAIITALVTAVRAPFALALIYIWIEYFRPQEVTAAYFSWIPISLTAGVFALIGLIIASPNRTFKPTFEVIWLLLLAAWITATTTWAIVPVAWIKWDTAFKTIVFSALLIQFISTKAQLEAVLLTIIAGSAAQIWSFGLKGLVTGGGYEAQLGVVLGNAGLAESSTLSVFSASLIPFYWFFLQHSILIHATKARRFLCWSAIAVTLSTIMATHARAGLLSLAVVGFILLARTKKGIGILIVGLSFSVLAIPLIASSTWFQRMNTLSDVKKDNSAMERIAVWTWTIDYVKKHPLGGGFNIDQTNSMTVEADTDTGFVTVVGRAFHSIYFEVLGEQGFPGLILYYGLVIYALIRLYRERKALIANNGDPWLSNFMFASLVSWLGFLIGAAFVGIAFMPYLFFFLVLSVSATKIASVESAITASDKNQKTRSFSMARDPK